MKYTHYAYNSVNLLKVEENKNNTIELDYDLLMSLYRIQSPSGYENSMIKFITNYIKTNHPGVTVKQDINGNLLITKGILKDGESYPCLVAHMDEVPEFNANKQVVFAGNFAFTICQKTGERDGLGADDKNGIYIALELLKIHDKLKIFFSVGEEIGLFGTNRVDINFFNDIGYMLQCDRRGHDDIITSTNGVEVMNDYFLYEILDHCEAYGYSENSGTSTDIGGLKKRGVNVAACNISCGYYNEHMDDEFTYFPALVNALNFTNGIINIADTKRYPHKATKIKYSYSTYNYANAYGYEDYEDSEDYKSDKKNEKLPEKATDLEDLCTDCVESCIHCPYY